MSGAGVTVGLPSSRAARASSRVGAIFTSSPVARITYFSSGIALMPFGPRVRLGPLLPSRLTIASRKISPNASVTMAR